MTFCLGQPEIQFTTTDKLIKGRLKMSQITNRNTDNNESTIISKQ